MGKGGGDRDQGTVTTRGTVAPDPASQRFIDQLRQQALQAAGVATGGPLAAPVPQPGAIPGQAEPRRDQFGVEGGAIRGQPLGFIPGQNIPGTAAPPAGATAPPGSPESFFVGPDPRSISEQIQPFLDPFQEQVIGGVRGEFDFLREQAGLRTAQEATQAGAFGGSRAAVLEGSRLGALDRAQTSQIAGLLSGGFTSARDAAFRQNELNRQLQERQLQEPLFRQRQALDFLNLGLGPVGQATTGTTTTRGPGGSRLGAAAGGAVAGSAFGLPGIIGGGLLGGIFG